MKRHECRAPLSEAGRPNNAGGVDARPDYDASASQHEIE
jgi:hypothetical protein